MNKEALTQMLEDMGEQFGRYVATATGDAFEACDVEITSAMDDCYKAAQRVFYDERYRRGFGPHGAGDPPKVPLAITAVAAILADEFRRRYEANETTSPAAFVDKLETELVFPLYSAIFSSK